MAKEKTVFVCQNCGYDAPKSFGKCPTCNQWNTAVEEMLIKEIKMKKSTGLSSNSIPQSITEIVSGAYQRYDTGIGELNRVLGGGIVKGSLTLISGAPGIGKSTLLLQTADYISKKLGKVLYVSGEESSEQIKIRGDRIGSLSSNLYILSETNLERIEEHLTDIKPVFIIIDSIQTLFKSSITSAPGSVSQVRECANELMRIAKVNNIPFFIVAHVTKHGELAGPRVLEHMVDTVLSFEGERTQEFRILRTMKNRFGTTSEIGVFEMQQQGLKEITNPSEVFLEDSNYNSEGSVAIGLMEGSRPILVEIQALVSKTNLPMPRRTAVGIDNARLNLILAVLEKKLGAPFFLYDVYVNVVGGLSMDGTYGDLGLALALYSSLKGKSFKLNKTLVVGEIGLIGEVRPISFSDRLVSEGTKMGFENFIIPNRNKDKMQNNKSNIIGVDTLMDAVKSVF